MHFGIADSIAKPIKFDELNLQRIKNEQLALN